MKNLRMAGVALAVIVLAAACQAAMKKPEPADPEPTPKPAPPGIEGTWTRTSSYVEDGEAFTEVMLLTFIGERFIESFEKRDATGVLIDDWPGQGGWTATETMIQKKWYNDDEHGAVDKEYYWVDDDEHGVLFVECWECDGRDTQFSRLERVPNALPLTDLFGTWLSIGNDETQNLTISPDGNFVLTTAEAGSTSANIVTGVGVPDLENYFINLTGLMEQEAGSTEPGPMFDGVGRIAFAPGTKDGGIRVSTWWNETPIAEQLGKYHPYGNYDKVFRKDAQNE